MSVRVGDVIYVVRDDDRAIASMGDARHQVYRRIHDWDLNRFAVRLSGPFCTVGESIALEFVSDKQSVSLFLNFTFEDGKLLSLTGEGYYLKHFDLSRDTNG